MSSQQSSPSASPASPSSPPNTPTYKIHRSSTSPPPITRKKLVEIAKYNEGDFIKPDPQMTMLETRRYILEELQHMFSKLTLLDSFDFNTRSTLLSNPRLRLSHVQELLQTAKRQESANDVSYKILKALLTGDTIDNEDPDTQLLINMVWGFVKIDLLPNDRTIYSYWNYSPFEPLRNAPPLTDEPDTIEYEEEQQEEEQEEENTNRQHTSDFGLLGLSEHRTFTITIDPQSFLMVTLVITIWLYITVFQLAHCNPNNQNITNREIPGSYSQTR